eukprot:17286-Heterococcus_DN1.PRE.2
MTAGTISGASLVSAVSTLVYALPPCSSAANHGNSTFITTAAPALCHSSQATVLRASGIPRGHDKFEC